MAKRLKTWHSSGEDLARAFLDQEAPRGFVSSKNMFFHGPVLYSQWHGNPIAALVRVPGELEWLVTGTSDACPKKEITTKALNRVIRDNGDHGYRHVSMEKLNDILSWNGEELSDYARFNSIPRHRSNDEKDRPPLCELREDRFRAWITGKIRDAELGIEKACKTKFATGNKAAAFRYLAACGELADLVREKFGFTLPVVENIQGLRARAQHTAELAEDRRLLLRERKRREELEVREAERNRGFEL